MCKVYPGVYVGGCDAYTNYNTSALLSLSTFRSFIISYSIHPCIWGDINILCHVMSCHVYTAASISFVTHVVT